MSKFDLVPRLSLMMQLPVSLVVHKEVRTDTSHLDPVIKYQKV